MNLFLKIFLIFLLFSENYNTLACINQSDPSVPACPTGKTQILDDTYPAAFVTIGPGQADPMGSDFVLKAFASTGSTKIVLSGWKQTQIEQLKESLKKLGYDEGQINKKIINYEQGTSYQWQQDFFKSEFDPKTGAPIMRPVNSYMKDRISASSDSQKYFQSLDDTLNKEKLFCTSSISTGGDLPSKLVNTDESNYFGGNMQGFPGGLCLVGDSLPNEVFADICKGREEFAVKIPTKWLGVGHVDEAVSVIKDNTAKAPCNYAVLRASPMLALDLMAKSLKNEKLAKAKFEDVPSGTNLTSRSVCNAWDNYNSRSNVNQKPNQESSPLEPDKATKGTYNFHFPSLINNAHAGAGILAVNSNEIDCYDLSNEQAYAAIKDDPDLYDFNMQIENAMTNAEKTIKESAKKNGCPNIKVIPVPNLFRGNTYAEKPGPSDLVKVTLSDGRIMEKPIKDFTEDEIRLVSQKERLAIFHSSIDNRSGHSFNPNPSNCVSIGNTVFFPEQKNAIFSNYLKEQADKLKLNSNFVNTWASAHVQDGNLHCSSQTVRYCRPIKQ